MTKRLIFKAQAATLLPTEHSRTGN